MMETVWRVAIVYLFIVIGLRVLGKREFGELSPLELVTLLIIPEIVSQGLVREDFSLTNALVGISTLFLLVFFSSMLQHKSARIEKAIGGSPSVLVQNGAYVGEHMNKERVSPEEVFGAMHRSGLDRLEQVKWAILESDGKIAIVPQEQSRNVASQSEHKELML